MHKILWAAPPPSEQPRVAVVGHSQLPKEIWIPDVELRIFRAPGGRADSFFENGVMSAVLDWPHDYCVLWLGSNDIDANTSPFKVAQSVIAVARAIESSCNSKVYPVLVEPRKYPQEFPVPHQTYRKIQEGVNRRLKRALRGRCFVHFNTTWWVESLSEDGVHWRGVAQQKAHGRLIDSIFSILENHAPPSSEESD